MPEGPPDIGLDDLDPELADQIRDALALARCWLDRDEEGARVIMAAVSDSGEQAGLIRVLASLLGMILREFGIRPEQVTGFQGELL